MKPRDKPFLRGHRQLIGLLAVAGVGLTSMAGAGQPRSVVELYTSQGCSSCPPADALAGRLSTDPSVLVLSFHVTYWDDLGWKDAFSSQASTDRQYGYAHTMRQPSVFTPQVIVNGRESVIGSRESDVRRALARSGEATVPVSTELLKQADGSFKLVLKGTSVTADVWEIRYVRHAITRIGAGENEGRSLETFNNVTQLHRLGAFEPGTLTLRRLEQPEDGLAVIVQKPSAGEILGAAAY